MASRQYNGQRSRAQSAASNATTQTAASTASTSIPMPTANNNNNNNSTTTAATAATASSSSGTTAGPQSTAQSSIRRNLFHHHLSRRPPSSSTTSGATTATGNNGTSIGGINPSSKGATAATVTSTADNADIVVRDKNGGYRIDVPMLPPGIVGDDGNSSGIEGMESSEGDGKISEREKEKIEASLVEMMYRSRNRQMNNEPSEILGLIHQSLRNRVAELDEDKWMYEVEEEVKA